MSATDRIRAMLMADHELAATQIEDHEWRSASASKVADHELAGVIIPLLVELMSAAQSAIDETKYPATGYLEQVMMEINAAMEGTDE